MTLILAILTSTMNDYWEKQKKRERIIKQIANKIGDELLQLGLFVNIKPNPPLDEGCNFSIHRENIHFPQDFDFNFNSLEEIPLEVSDKIFGKMILVLEDLEGNELDIHCHCHFDKLEEFEIFDPAKGDYDNEDPSIQFP